MRSLAQCCQAASPMVCMPASTCRCLISLECVKAWGSTCPERVTGTRIAFAFFLIWPLCSAREQHWRTTIWKRLQSLRVSHTGFRRSCPVSRRTKVSSQPNALFPPVVGSCSRTAVSNSSSRSNSWRSTMTWYSSPESEVNWRWTTSWRSLLTSELVCDSMSQCMAVLFPVPVLATGGLSLAVQRGSYLGNRPCSLRPGTTLLVVARRSFNSVSYKGQSNHCP